MNMQPENNDNFLCNTVHAVEVKNICKSYGIRKNKTKVLNNINLTIERGEIYGLLGPSGCGKTTLLRMIVGRLYPDSGNVKIFGYPVGSKESKIPGAGVGYMPQVFGLHEEFTIKETLNFFGCLYHMKSTEIEQRTTFLMELLHLPNQSLYIKNLSGGQKRRVSFAVSLYQNAPLLILDEPTVGLDPLLVRNIWNHLLMLITEMNVSVILTTHCVEEARKANMVGFMRDGRILAEGSPDDMLAKYQCRSLERVFIRLCKFTDQSPTTSNEPTDCHNEDFITNPFEEVTAKKLNSRDMPPEGNNYQVKRCNKLAINHCLTSINWTKAIIHKNFINLTRNIGILLFQFIVPSLLLSIFCVSLGQKVGRIDVGLINNDQSELQYGKDFVQAINNETVTLHLRTDLDSAVHEVSRNKLQGLIYISSNFSSNFYARINFVFEAKAEVIKNSKIRIWTDQVDLYAKHPLEFEFIQSVNRFTTSVLKKHGKNPKAIDLPISIENEEKQYSEIDNSSMKFLAPAFMLLIAYFMALALTNFTLIVEQQNGLTERIHVTGVTNLEILLGSLISQGFIMIGQVGLALIFSLLIFQVPCIGSVFWVMTLLFLQATCGMCQGLLVSAITDDEFLAVYIQLPIYLVCGMLSGAYWPLEGMSKWLKTFSYLLPQTLPIQALRAISFRGWGIDNQIVWRGFVVTLTWISLLLILTLVILKYRH